MSDARPPVFGLDLDPQTRCAHYHSALDVIAIKMRCCGAFYACRECHDAIADHPARLWPRAEWDEAAILCGACGEGLSIEVYLACNDRCPACAAPFNPGCRLHHYLYFEAG